MAAGPCSTQANRLLLLHTQACGLPGLKCDTDEYGNTALSKQLCRLVDEMGQPIGPYRVWLQRTWVPGLAMSRALGDKLAHRYAWRLSMYVGDLARSVRPVSCLEWQRPDQVSCCPASACWCTPNWLQS